MLFVGRLKFKGGGTGRFGKELLGDVRGGGSSPFNEGGGGIVFNGGGGGKLPLKDGIVGKFNGGGIGKLEGKLAGLFE